MCDGRTIVAGNPVSRYSATSRSSQAILSLEYCQYGFRSGVDSVTGSRAGGVWYAEAVEMNTYCPVRPVNRSTSARTWPGVNATKTVLSGGWTSLARMLAGKPVIVHGDGTSLWTVTHTTDFARAFVPLLGHPRTLGEAFHITSDDVLTWDQIAHALGAALGVTPRLVHVPSDVIAAHDPEWGAGLLGDKTHSMVFDNAKVKSVVPGWHAVVPFERGAREIVAWHTGDPSRQVVDGKLDALMDKLAADFAVG